MKDRRSERKEKEKQKMSRIIVPHGVRTEIAEMIGCSASTVRYALYGLNNTELTKRIRKTALKLGGVAMRAKKNERETN